MATDTALATLNLTHEDLELIAFAKTFLATAEAITITSSEEAQEVVDQLRAIKECSKTVEEVRKGYTDPLRERAAAYMDAFRPAADVLAKAEVLGKGALTVWDKEQRRLAAIETKRIQAEQEAERQRLADEQRKAETLLAQADAAAASGDVAAAEALEERASKVQSEAVYIATPITVGITAPKGSSTRQIWKATVIDAALVPYQFKIVNEKALNAYAAAMKESAVVPGVRFYAEESVAIR